MLKLPDGTVKVLIEGMERVKISKFIDNPDYMEVEAEILPDAEDNSTELEALVRAVLSQFEEYVKLSKKTPPEVLVSVNQIEDNSKLADTIASHLALKIADKQALLEGRTLKERFEKILGFMDAEITLLEVENKIKTRVKKQMEKSQKEYYLNEQMKAIQKELGDNDEEGEISDYMAKIEKAKLSKEAKEKALAEVKKLKNMSGMSSEATVIRNYLDWLLDIPWKKRSKVNKDISKAMEVLEKDHYGWKRSRNALSNIWRCSRVPIKSKVRFCVWSVLRAWAKLLWANPSPRQPGAVLCGLHWAVCAMKRKSADIGGRISVPCRAKLLKA